MINNNNLEVIIKINVLKTKSNHKINKTKIRTLPESIATSTKFNTDGPKKFSTVSVFECFLECTNRQN